ncbi:MAG: hypothetical protein ACRDV3_14855 [Acidothermaceae bacterium]
MIRTLAVIVEATSARQRIDARWSLMGYTRLKAMRDGLAGREDAQGVRDA